MAKPALPSSATTEWDRDAALTTARILLEIKAVNFRPEEPYTFTSGWKSPVYIDCRRIIYFPQRPRQDLRPGGGKNAAATSAMRRSRRSPAAKPRASPSPPGSPTAWPRPCPMSARSPRASARNALIEGDVPVGKRTLLVEDLTTDGGSKIRFANALRDAGAIVNHTFVVFFYGVFPGAFETLANMDITLHHLCTWWDVLEACKDRPYFSDTALSEVRRFLENPVAWSAAHGGIASAEEALARKASES